MRHFATPHSVGVWQTFSAMGCIYLVVMMIGAFGYRLPPPGWVPRGWTAPDANAKSAMITRGNVHLNQAWKTPQFWLIWGVLCLTSPRASACSRWRRRCCRKYSAASSSASDTGFASLSADQKKQIATIAAGFTGLLSLFNILGRFGWASLSDYIGRKNTYFVFFVLGMILYALAPSLGMRAASRSSCSRSA